MPRILFVSGFHPNTRARDLAHEFERFGPLVRCDVPAPRNPNSTNPYAFVEFRSTRDAEDAYYDLHGRSFEGSRLSIQWAKNPPSSVWRYDRRSPPRSRGGRDRERSRSPRRRRDDDRDRDRDRDRDEKGGRESRDRGERDKDDRDPPRRRRSRTPERKRSASPERREDRDRDADRARTPPPVEADAVKEREPIDEEPDKAQTPPPEYR